MFNIIDDDEWFELSLELSSTMQALPPGSRLIECLAIPTFAAAIKASGTEFPGVLTVPFVEGQTTQSESVAVATRLAERSRENSPTPRGITIAVTQTDDGNTFSIVVAGLPGERCSFSSFELRPGSHNIDAGFDVLRMLQGWAIRSRPTSSGSSAADAA